jgi:hypothetical protein
MWTWEPFDNKLGLKWDILNPLASHWSLSKNRGTLTITTHTGSFARGRKDYKNLFLLGLPHPDRAGFSGHDVLGILCAQGFVEPGGPAPLE